MAGFVFLIPYATLQVSGGQVLLRVVGYGALNSLAAVAVASMLVAIFVSGTGLRGATWASVVQDTFVLIAVVIASLVTSIRFFGSPAVVIGHVLMQPPHWRTLTGDTSGNGVIWFVSGT